MLLPKLIRYSGVIASADVSPYFSIISQANDPSPFTVPLLCSSSFLPASQSFALSFPFGSVASNCCFVKSFTIPLPLAGKEGGENSEEALELLFLAVLISDLSDLSGLG
eukprot:TRINITY_DN14892_c0_g1_i12.p2 TRINITY_DN14892_c0_g1~~TRINITY_DN14892_c0_g1_i12.p2  ORF type:complete len:109 (+),score=11.81 TRINITY_DN14892_c0_g1_i12:710-1036(+)